MLKISRFIWLIVLSALSIQIACAQRDLKEIVGTDEIDIAFKHVAMRGETKKYLTSFKHIPNAPELPKGYRLFADKSYYITTKVIELSDPMITFKVPARSEEEFSKIRVMRLRTEVPFVDGYVWRDCTVSVDNIWQSPRYDEEHAGEQLPDYSQKKIKCHIKDGLRPDEYFAIVVQEQAPPSVAFSELTFAVEGKPRSLAQTDASYKITIKNAGPKDIGELKIFSNVNAYIGSVRPDKGNCWQSDKYNPGTTECTLGKLPANGQVAVYFEISRIQDVVGNPGQNNFGWNVDSVIKEDPKDPVWPANVFSFKPLSDKYWNTRVCCETEN